MPSNRLPEEVELPSSITALERPISHIFNNDYVFRIPSYQRPYAWTTDKAADLMDDLTQFMGLNMSPVDAMPPYFLGSIVLIKTETSPASDIVDGQQRLTTLILLLSAIRSKLDGKDRTDISHLIYESGSTILGTQDRFRLSLRERDQEFFKNYVQIDGGFEKLLKLPEPDSDSQRNLFRNAELFAERIERMPQSELVRLAQFIVTRCYLVIVATPDLDSAFRIFSVLNSRGLNLSATDILKAEVIGALPSTHRDIYTKKWEDIEEDLGREAFLELFSHIRMVYRKAKPSGTLLKEFREHVIANKTSASLIDDVLVPMGSIYEALIDNEFQSTELGESINEHLKWLNRLEFKDWLPPALRFVSGSGNKPAAINSFLSDLERLSYWMLITRCGINDRIERFSRLTDAIDRREVLTPFDLSNLEKKEALSVLNGAFYSLLNARARTTIVLRLDSLLAGGGATYDFPEITLEHVCPQNPSEDSCWSSWLPDPDKREQLVHQLGNLALLSRKKNSAASNYDFDKKKKVYFTKKGASPFALTTQVLQHSKWTEQVMKTRQRELVSTLAEHWRLT